MDINSVSAILQSQRDFFFTHKTKDPEFRLEQLKILRKAILKYEDRLYEAFWKICENQNSKHMKQRLDCTGGE